MYVHALHTVHALRDLRVAAGRLRDGPLRWFHVQSADPPSGAPCKAESNIFLTCCNVRRYCQRSSVIFTHSDP
jgi:hypothetical protein